MANIVPVVNRTTQGANSIVTASWINMGNADTGLPVALTDFADRSIQVSGTMGAATVTIQGSNDIVNFNAGNFGAMPWNTMRDPQGVALTFTTADIKQMLEMSMFVRVITTGGTGSAITVTMAGRQLIPLAWS
jgi:hypothetical protein